MLPSGHLIREMRRHDLTQKNFWQFFYNLLTMFDNSTILTIFDNFWWQFLMTIFDENFWWQFWQFWQIFGKHLRFAENFQIADFQIFWKFLWPETWHLRHWLHFWQLRTTIWTITLWPLNIEWWWQHSQFLRCVLHISYRKFNLSHVC